VSEREAALGTETIPGMLAARAEAAPDSLAILGVEGETLSYGQLHAQVRGIVGELNGLGIGRGDIVAMALPDGPHTAVCTLSVACAATAAPLNPAGSAAEFESYLSRMGPRGLILADGAESPAMSAANKLGIPVFRLRRPEGNAAGACSLRGPGNRASANPTLAGPQDVALMLHTSGSTSQPKLVPLSHRNLYCSAHHMAASLDLSPRDRCLGIMPLFHGHGLIGAVLASLAAGGSVVATPGFRAPSFLDWLERFHATWYTAVPAMHRSILDRASNHAAANGSGSLRFIRSCSAPLSPQLMEETERHFGVPMLEAYGMTEAAHQIAVNSLPPGVRKPGSVGRAVGCEVAIFDQSGGWLPAGKTGEVVIRGDNVTAGYLNEPEANSGSFAGGWLRTGDLGQIDADGYLFLTGRSKEIINRGGEKISPREVEDALAEHPAVAAAMAFSLADARLGEEVGAAIVLRDGASATEDNLREHAARRLAEHKVPRRVVFVNELPTGPTGKPDRIGFAARFTLAPSPGPTIRSLVARHAALAPNAHAVLGAGCEPLAYGRLLKHIDETAQVLNSFGIGRGDRVAMVLADGPEAAVCFLALASAATAAPLNPAYRRAELEACLEDLKPKALILAAGEKSPAVDAATRQGIPILWLERDRTQPAGLFRLLGWAPAARPIDAGPPGPSDIALVVRTSGSTARPKIVPSTHANICAAAANSVRALALGPADCCLNIMPMFHGFGLSAAVLGSLASGGSVACTPGFHAPSFFEWLEVFRPTWYSAVPAVHQAILARAEQNKDVISKSRLRFVRSGSAPLEPQLLERLERVLGCPVLEGYGASETYLAASNPLPPAVRKPGSVGLATGCEIAIVDPQGNPLARGAVGEVLVRGPSVVSGYDNDAESNRESFTGGWFRTGDLGRFDEDGYLFLAGRVKEVINRGGEKVSPREVEQALLQHPAVAQAIAFPIPDVRLGEDVGAAVVLHAGASAAEGDLCEFASRRLADFKVPRRVVLLEDLPASPTGKPPRRLDLAAKLGLTGEAEVHQELDLYSLIARHARTSPGAPAIFAGGLEPLTYGQLLQQVEETVSTLNGFGIGRADRVAILLPAGAHAALCALSVACGAAAAPLNPAYTAAEIELNLAELKPKALIIERGAARTASRIATEKGILVLSLIPSSDASGTFQIEAPQESGASIRATPPTPGAPDDVAFVLHTSGSTSRPKLVSWTHARLCRVAHMVSDLLRLTSDDRYLNLMPAHHGAGLRPLVSAFAAGGSIAYPPALHAPAFFESLEKFQPTWFSAVPSVHAAILRRAPQYQDVIARCRLRFIRSGSAGLPPRLRDELERTFGVPIVEAYGSTETLQAASEALPPDTRKTGSVGRPTGCEIRILDERGGFLPPGQTGEVVVRGPNIFSGYDNDPEATQAAFHADWYRTGDLGWLDAEGFLFLNGRVKEVINRGGEKISPREVEEALLEHPAVAQAVVFPIPDARLGEDIGAAVVLRGGAAATVEELREFAALRVVDFKVPRRIVFLEQLPGGPVGKPQRIGLAAALGLTAPAPAGETEAQGIRDIHSMVARHAASSPDAPAILGIGREPLTFALLLQHMERIGRELNEFGIGHGDRVATVLPDGPEAAVFFLAASNATTVAPLNPAYTSAEFQQYFSDLKPKAVIVASGGETTAAEAARRMGVPVLVLVPGGAGAAGVSRLEGQRVSTPTTRTGPAAPEDVALVLQTSGSTARPKLVPLTHANLCASARNTARSLALTASDRSLGIMPLFHIHGLMAILMSITEGGSIVSTPGFHAPSFFEWLDEFGPTWYTCAPALHQAIVERASQHSGAVARSRLRFVRSGASSLSPTLLEAVEAALGVPMIEFYGMTEASQQMATNPLPPGKRKPGSVGRPFGCELAVMDDYGNLLPRGHSGEIVVRGANVTAGYLNTSEAPVHPFTDGWFHTGDLGRFDEEGYLFLDGRSKEMINRGGEKISPREVDDVLLQHPAIAAAVTFALPDSRLGEDVGAAVVLRDNPGTTEAEIREFVAERLAAFKVPRSVFFLDDLPKGPTGKPLRIGLAERLGLRGAAPTPGEAGPGLLEPRSPAERALAAIWQDVLRVERVGRHDDFFKIGGDSILATQVIVRVREELGVELQMFRIFGAPVLVDLARWIESAPRDVSPLALPVRRLPRGGTLPLSYSQQRMWFLSQFEESSAAYIVVRLYRIRGPLNVSALHASLQRIVERHEILRTTVAIEDGVLCQRVLENARVELPETDLSETPESEREAVAEAFGESEYRRNYDLARETPLRCRLLRFDAHDCLLAITVHHIAYDGWSKSLLLRDLEALYGHFAHGTPLDLPELPFQYADYAEWLRGYVESSAGDRLIAYWKERLAGVPALLELPTDRPRPARQTFEGGTERLLIPRELLEAAQALSQNHSATLFMTLLACFKTQLARYSGQFDICVGSPIASRIRKETENLVGSFINSLAMRTDLFGDPSFRELLERVRETALGAYDHQDLPLERLIEVLQPRRSLSYTPLFQVFFQLRNFPEAKPRLAGLDVTELRFDPGGAQFDLTMETTETPAGLDCWLTYNRALFDAETAQRMLRHFRTVLEAVTANPDLPISAIPLVTAEERHRLVVERNQTKAEYPEASVLSLFAEQAQSTPGAIAVADPRQHLTYAELDRRANAVAERLRAAGAGAGSVVAVCIGRSVSTLAGLLGVWKAGAAYVAFDPDYPKDRLAYIVQDAGANVLLAESRYRALFPESIPTVLLEHCAQAPAAPIAVTAGPDDLAYVLYTSGSTGRPKGVAVHHRALVNLLWSLRRRLEATAEDVVLAISTISFDISGMEMFFAATLGGRVFIAGRDAATDGRKLAETIDASGATIMFSTPAGWRILLDSGWRGAPGIKILCGGETLTRQLADQLLACGRVWNGYGPTETTIFSVMTEVHPGEATVPIGKPLDNTRLYVLDANRQLAPDGVPGVLHIGGDGVAAGYWKRPDLTAERFIPNPIPGAPPGTLYDTGDLVRYLPGGNLEFLRRVDNQIKLRGFRIELEEIETVLAEHPRVNAAAAMVFEAGPGDQRLAAYFVPKGPAASEAELRDWLRSKLPSYMVPSIFAPLDKLPLSPNGKVDRKALKVPSSRTKTVEAPAGNIETLLLQIWEEVLGRRGIGLDDDFFALGGHSLLGARLLARVEAAFGKRLTLASFFEAPTVAQMVAHLESGGVAPSAIIRLQPGRTECPLYLLHPSPIFRALTLALPEELPVRLVAAFHSTGLSEPYRLEDLAARQLAAIREFQPEGPFALAGWCADGVLALEMARQMKERGESVPLVAMIDSFNPARSRRRGRLSAAGVIAVAKANRLRYHLANLSGLTAAQAADYARQRWESAGFRARTALWRAMYDFRGRPVETPTVEQIMYYAIRQYEARPYAGRVLLFRAAQRPAGDYADPAAGWRGLLSRMEVCDVPGGHRDVLVEPNVQVLATRLAERLAAFAEL
jgi:amino acid adenylation domain-containing protein